MMVLKQHCLSLCRILNDPSHQTSGCGLENDRPGEFYITMDPEEYICPPKGYKRKQNQSYNP